MGRTLIAGFGNVLRGDDGFGVEVVRRLGDAGVARPGVELMEVGTAGIRLAQELLTPCDLLIIADAMTRGGEPGTVYVLEVGAVEAVQRVDMHVAIPSHALSVAKALGVLPAKVVLVGCEPMQVDEMTCDLTGELTPPVRAAVDVAVRRIHHLLSMTDEAGGEIARRDEMLELLFWFEGEGLGASATLPAMTRFLVQPEEVVRRTLADLISRGLVVEAAGDPAEYLLTESGRAEGGRRFADQFSDLTGQGHGECNDPGCDCHDNPAGAAECHAAARATGGHKH